MKGNFRKTVSGVYEILAITCAFALLFAALPSCRESGSNREGREAEFTLEEELEGKIRTVIDKIINENMSKEQKCRAVYRYIQENIAYAPLFERDELPRAAYRALFITGEGDCYSYFAAAKAFFDHLGIESCEVRRLDGYTDDTHFWLLVNIGENGNDRWYHFDATVMRQDYAINSCLLTDAQLEAYSRLRYGFYKYDKSKYPAVESEIITENPDLDGYIGQ